MMATMINFILFEKKKKNLKFQNFYYATFVRTVTENIHKKFGWERIITVGEVAF